MRRKCASIFFSVTALLLGFVVIEEISGCARTIPTDSLEQTTILETTTTTIEQTTSTSTTTSTTSSTTTTTTTAFQCPACGDACGKIQVCNNIGVGQWTSPSPAADKGNGCLNFPACIEETSDCETSLVPNPNIGSLECQPLSDGIACITGTANGVTGDWQSTGTVLETANDIGVSAYCNTPTDCKTIISSMFIDPDPEWTLTFQNDPTITYRAPDFGTPYSDPSYMTVTRVCCGTCAACNGADAVCA